MNAAFGGGVGAALEASEAAPSTEGQRDEEEGRDGNIPSEVDPRNEEGREEEEGRDG